MSDNPYQPAQDSQVGVSPASSKVSGPSIALIVAGILSLCSAGYLLFSGGAVLFLGDQVMEQMNDAQRQQMEQAAKQGVDPSSLFKGVGIGYGIIGVLGLLCSAVVIYGAFCMKSLKSYGLAMTAAVLSCIPFLQPCCLISLPIGIWAIVVLISPDVKSAFR